MRLEFPPKPVAGTGGLKKKNTQTQPHVPPPPLAYQYSFLPLGPPGAGPNLISHMWAQQEKVRGRGRGASEYWAIGGPPGGENVFTVAIATLAPGESGTMTCEGTRYSKHRVMGGGAGGVLGGREADREVM